MLAFIMSLCMALVVGFCAFESVAICQDDWTRCTDGVSTNHYQSAVPPTNTNINRLVFMQFSKRAVRDDYVDRTLLLYSARQRIQAFSEH